MFHLMESVLSLNEKSTPHRCSYF